MADELGKLLSKPLFKSSKERAIIAMKGAPFTRKTEIATLIAKTLNCPILSVEDFLEVMNPDHLQISQDLAFKITCQMAKSHLQRKVCDNVVLDSPLSSKLHFDELVKLAESLDEETPIVIVECKPENLYSWETKFEEHVQRNDETRKWYKANDWDDVMKAIEEDYDETSEYGSKVTKLIFDPIWDNLVISEPDSLRIRERKSKAQPPPLIEAIKHVRKCKKGEVVIFSQWRHSKDRRHSGTPYLVSWKDDSPNPFLSSLESYFAECSDSSNLKIVKKQGYCSDGHTITKYLEQGFDEFKVVNCMACGMQIKGSAYACKYCSLALHKDCAESCVDDNKWRCPLQYPDESHYSSMRNRGPTYKFPEEYVCASCEEDEESFSNECKSCLFETNLKCRLLPSIIKHNCEQHFLSLVLSPASYNNAYQEGYKCTACGELIWKIYYSCKICSIYYHVGCVAEIQERVEDEHGGHHHHLQLKFSNLQAEGYICDECLERRDPQLWFYSCEDCKYEVHLDCIFQKNEKISPLNWGSQKFY